MKNKFLKNKRNRIAAIALLLTIAVAAVFSSLGSQMMGRLTIPADTSSKWRTDQFREPGVLKCETALDLITGLSDESAVLIDGSRLKNLLGVMKQHCSQVKTHADCEKMSETSMFDKVACYRVLGINVNSMDECKDNIYCMSTYYRSHITNCEIPGDDPSLQLFRNLCNTTAALANKDTTGCYKIDKLSWADEQMKDETDFSYYYNRNSCLWSVSDMRNDPGICDNMTESPEKDMCYLNYAVKTNNTEMCSKISDLYTNAKDVCLHHGSYEKAMKGAGLYKAIKWKDNIVLSWQLKNAEVALKIDGAPSKKNLFIDPVSSLSISDMLTTGEHSIAYEIKIPDDKLNDYEAIIDFTAYEYPTCGCSPVKPADHFILKDWIDSGKIAKNKDGKYVYEFKFFVQPKSEANSFIPQNTYYTLSYNATGLDLYGWINNKQLLNATDNGKLASVTDDGGMWGTEPVNALLVYGKNTLDLEMKIPEANLKDYDCTVNLSVDSAEITTDPNTPGSYSFNELSTNLVSFNLREMIDSGKVVKTKDGTYKYTVTFSTGSAKVAR